MAGIIKRQILKFLTKFTDGLSPDDVQLSSLKGEAEIRNIALNPNALQDLINLPTWIRINSATVNSVSLKIQFMHLQSRPIRISLDHVKLEAEALVEPRPPNGPSPIQEMSSNSSGQAGSYGMTEGIIDGIRLEINAVSITFVSTVFTATLSIQQIIVFSAKNNWAVAQDLRESRFKNDKEVVARKKIQWASVRIEATWKDAAPVRLITNHGEVRILLRRRLSDCAVLATRIEVLLDDLLWILTDRQIQATFICVKSLSESIEASRRQTMSMQRSNSEVSIMSDIPIVQNQVVNLVESSHHFCINRLDLHICEESEDASAVQLTLHQLALDYYPGRKAAKSRKDFNPYTDAMMARDKWVEGLLQDFRNDFKKMREATKPTEKIVKLKENCLIFRLFDLELYQVSSPARQNTTGRKLLSSARADLHLPDSTPFLHFETTDYFTPDGRDYPMPHNNVYIQLNMLVFEFDKDTVLWLHKISSEASKIVQTALEELDMTDSEPNPDHQDLLIDILMPKVTIDKFCVQASQISLTNRLNLRNLSALDNILEIFKFVSSSTSTDQYLTSFLSVVHRTNDPVDIYLQKTSNPELCRKAVIRSAKDDITCLFVDSMVLEIIDENQPDSRSKQTTLLQPLSLDVFVTESRIIARIPVISAVLDHEDYIDLLTLLNDLSPVLAKLSEGPTEAEKEATAAEIVPSPRIDLLIKTVQIELIMVPFSSLMAQNQESDPLNGPEMTPARNSSPKNLPKSTLKLQLSPVLARIQPDGKIEVKSTVDLLTRNYQMPIKNFENSANLNGAMVLKMIQDPNLLITLHEDKINAIIQNTSLELQNSILGDIVPFLEAPFPPDPAGAPVINLTIENVMIKLLADIPTMYANSYFADLDLEVDQMSIRLNADGSIAIVKNQRTELTNGIAGLTVDPLRRPQAPPRPSIMMRSVSNQTERSALSEKTNTNEALLDLQEKNMMLLQEREALREALERMQTDLLESEDRALTYRSQLQSMKQLYNHAKR